MDERTCATCCKSFVSNRPAQKYCCPQCAHASRRTKRWLRCVNPACGKDFQATPSKIAAGTRCCCARCRHAMQRGPDRVCQNASCGRVLTRSRNGPRASAVGRDSGKYCSRECAWDARWGASRPRRHMPEHVRTLAARCALATTLRKKCKLLGVPFDPECTRQAVLDRDGWKCQECGVQCHEHYRISARTRRPSWRNAEHDHIVPLSRPDSPGNVFANSQCLCRKCNNAKRTNSRGQLRLDLERSVERWASVVQRRRQRSSRCCEATPAAVP